MSPALRDRALAVWLLVLVFVYPIPHTIALRNLLLVAGGVLALLALRTSGGAGWAAANLRRDARICGWLLFALSLWMLVQSAWISPRPDEALQMWRGDWLVALLVGAIAFLAGKGLAAAGSLRALHLVVAALALHMAWLLLFQAWHATRSASWPLGITPFGQKDYHSALVTMLLALLFGAWSSPRAGRPLRDPAWAQPLGLIALVLAGLAVAVLLARNAVLIAMALALAAGLLRLLRFGRKRAMALALAGLVVFTALSALVIRGDVRWQGFVAATRYALQSDSLYWLEPARNPPPVDREGKPIEESAYMRASWLRAGLAEIPNYPLGIGYGHKAFGWAIGRSRGIETGHESSHSGLLDFTLANGLPGIALWLALSAALIRLGWRARRASDPVLGSVLVFSVLAYLLRCLLDGHLSGWRLEMYALVVGLVLGSLAARQPREQGGP